MDTVGATGSPRCVPGSWFISPLCRETAGCSGVLRLQTGCQEPLCTSSLCGGCGGACWQPSGPVTRMEEPPLLPGVESVHATPAQGAGGHVPTCAQPRMESDFGFAGRTPSSSTVTEPLSRTQSLKNRVFRSPVFGVVSAAFNAQGRCVLPTDRLSAPHSPRSHVFSMQNTCIFVSTVMAGFTCPLGGAVACRR